ncbi:MAG: hypothetical protein AAFO29_15315 [Actinomycetota bacterium]
MIAAVGDTPYNILALLHILSAFAAFAPAFVYPFLANRFTTLPGDGGASVWGDIMANSRRIYGPMLIVTGILGFGLSGMSDGIYALSQTWLILAIIVWIAMNGVLHAVLVPAERALAGGDVSAKAKIDQFGPVMAILLVIMLFLMVFKPGL